MKAPEMMPLATAGGKSIWANLVNGVCSTKNKGGGITSRSLIDFVSTYLTRSGAGLPIHGQVVVNTVQQEVQCEEYRLVREVVVQVEQKPVKGIFQDCPNKVAY